MDKFEKLLKLLEERMEIAKKDASNSFSDMEYDRAIGCYHELDDILDEAKKF